MSFPRYPEYKDSGVEWLGAVPAHWQVMQIKRVTTLRSGDSISSDDIGEDGEFPVFGGNGLRGYTRSYTHEGFLPLIGRQGALCGNVNYARGKFWASEHAVVATPCNGADPIWLGETLRAMNLNQYSVSAAQPGLAVEAIGNLWVPVPAHGEQTAIAAFLDRETAKIDALVAEQETLIALLKEKRQAVISHAVTKGLNPDAPMKPSGIEWLGDVPAHWEVGQLKRMTSVITDGAHISPETEGGLFHFVSTRDLVDGAVCFEGALMTSASSYEYLVRTGCKPLVGDVLFSKDGTIGRTVVVREERDFVVASSLIIMRPEARLLNSEFLDCLCQSDAVQNQVDQFVKGAGLPRLSIQNLMKVFGVFPPLVEQEQIAAHLRVGGQSFELLIQKSYSGITLLKERRSALISAAVTGQIDVRGLAPA
ncbi:MAG: restriction endonuclease subunit S [Polycyclovorans sp.]|nr:restriction endonuclease subunit S [Polycyclovorans sp.]|tara:strand:+ start:19526 stop:20791 length:1266 start_codon:yes stop_codon:yes gene_type:complete